MVRLFAPLLLAALFLVSCTFYDETKSGRYTQVLDSDESTDPSYAIDFFRFGKFSQGVLRRFDLTSPNARDKRFEKDSFCVWTHSSLLEKDSFHWTFFTNGRRAEVEGRFVDSNTIEATIRNLQNDGDVRILRLERQPGDPIEQCRDQRTTLLSIQFPEGNEVSTPPVYTKRPVLSILWVGVRAVSTGGTAVYRGSYEISNNAISVGSYLLSSKNGFKPTVSPLRIVWPEPTLESQTRSGNSSISIGYPVVIDVSKPFDPDSRFEWNSRAEPVVATSFSRQTNPHVSFDHDSFGQVVVYVDGQLPDLGSRVKQLISILRPDGTRDPITAFADTDRHFFIANAYSRKDAITHIDLIEEVELQQFPMRMSAQWLNQGGNAFPRVFP